ncbi:MAG TPA: TolC family protein, partial [Polyangiaceae bacterium]|nr:TolC family protein [Polyangiaceae bacterium]
ESATLAERNAYPDLTVGAGIMYRGALPPMWLVTLGAPVPIFSGARQSHAAAESRAWASAAQSQVAELEQLLRLRAQERELAFGATLDMLAVYDQGLLVQSQATAESALTQYKVGKGSFSAVLEAQAGLVADQEGYLALLANAHRILIAEAEVSLADTAIPSGGAASGGMPGASAKPMNAPAMSSTAGASTSPAAAPSTAGSSSGM